MTLDHFLSYRNQHPDKLNELSKVMSWNDGARTKSQVSWAPPPTFFPLHHVPGLSLNVNNQEVVTTKKRGERVREDITLLELLFQLFCAKNKMQF